MRLPLLEKTIRDLMKKKTVVFIIFLQLFLVLALGAVLSNISILFEPKTVLIRPLYAGVVGMDPLQLEHLLQREEWLLLRQYPDEGTAMKAFMEGEVDAIISTDAKALPYVIELTLPRGDIRASILISLLKDHLEVKEDLLRRRYAPQEDAVHISSVIIDKAPEASAAHIFEILYAIVVPFFLLLPGILLASMIIDILTEDIDRKTIPLVLLQMSPERYVGELGVGVVIFSVIQTFAWMCLLALKGVLLVAPVKILWISLLSTFCFFLIATIITLLFPNKTKSQLVYSFVMIFVFSSLGLSAYHPLRLVTSYALGISAPAWPAIIAIYTATICVLFFLVMKFSVRLRNV